MAVIGARPASGLRGLPLGWGPIPGHRPRAAARPNRRRRAGLRAGQYAGLWLALLVIGVAALLAVFYLAQSSHVAASGYRISTMESRLVELATEHQELVLAIGRAQSPSEVARRAEDLGLVPIGRSAIHFAPPSAQRHP